MTKNVVYAPRKDWTYQEAQAGLCVTPEKMAKKMATDAKRGARRHVI